MDADDNCAVEWASQALVRCKQVVTDIPISIVCAVREFETWILPSLESIRGKPIRGSVAFNQSATFEGDLESLSGVKEWIGQQLPLGRAYKETTDQASMTALIDISLALSNSRSFRRLCHAVEELQSVMDSDIASH